VHDDLPPISSLTRIVTLLVILLPVVGLVQAVVFLWGTGFNWIYLGLMLGMYILTGLGVTIGYHRLFTHKSFDTNAALRFIFVVLGSMSVEGSLLDWAANHRAHHQHSDKEHDPHSPHTHGAGLLNLLRGVWHAHAGWFFKPTRPDFKRYIPDLMSDTLIRRTAKLFPLWVGVGLLLPALLGGLLTMSWLGVLLGFIWGGLVRIFLVHHVTWSVNSVCHIWGTRAFKSSDHSRNNPIFGVLAFGEGWHNNHHAFPASARHGLRWWQLDISYIIIRALERVGLAWNVRVPSPERIEARRRV